MQVIGILLSRSTYYQTIGIDLYEGLRSGLKQLGRTDLKIVTENIGFGADKQQCYRSAEKLLLEENASIVIAYIGHRTAQLLRPLFLATNRILIVLDAGANMPLEWPTCPNIFYHSLHNSLGASLAAKEAIKDGYKNAGMVTGYYDGGYLHTYSISKSFQDNGGTISFNHATGYKTEDFTMEPLKEHLNNFPESALLSIFSGDYVQWYFEQIKNTFEKENLPVYLTPFGLEETMLSDAVYPGDNAKGIAGWSKKIESTENQIFIETITESGKTPNLFSLLSWESATIAIKALELALEHKNNIQNISQDLQSLSFISPRGEIYFDSKTNTSISPLYKASIISNTEGKCELQLEGEVTEVNEYYKKLTDQDLDQTTSAWYNSYVCI
ncbi:ABC transporter substrate-binding protein [Flavobacterium hydatis]|uniref:ABC transporter substrate-binding protein n=1 Tax=Flavobacterium hydatis TaxID=991 RepID=A0A086AG62_FLAHY|nr:ABC transporter substrate-binding protein [Flavobacterium hydatis]KFF15676.1 ABC transporter substrate-binding protein [Flavobacterium hydatis]OXA86567.1 ABC transporter substrate-binding protein [Flavobacterium hydatis]